MDSRKAVLITGGTNGIGKAIAIELVKLGNKVTITGQTKEKCSLVAEQIQITTGLCVDWIASDLSTLEGIRSTVHQFKTRNDSLHVLINNAGALFFRKIITIDGFEKTFALNHLNYFYLTYLLLDLIKESQPARIINVTSMAHKGSNKFDFDNLNGEKYFFGWEAYSKSKLCNLLFTYELARRLSGEKVTVNAFHPGYVGTSFAKNNGILFKVFTSIGSKIFARTPEKGAETGIFLATNTDVESITGKYFVDRLETRSSELSMDKSIAAKLWQVSMKIIQ